MAESLDGTFSFLLPFLIYLFIQLFNNYIYSFANFIYYQFILFTHFFIHPASSSWEGDRKAQPPYPPPTASSCGSCLTPSAAIPEHSPYLGRGTGPPEMEGGGLFLLVLGFFVLFCFSLLSLLVVQE